MYILKDIISQLAEPIMFKRPGAIAEIEGSAKFHNIEGTVLFYPTSEGTLVVADIRGLPKPVGSCSSRVFGFHIHEGTSCTGNAEDTFANAGGHFNPGGCQHPYHAGDLSPLFENRGHACMAVLTDRFTVEEILGRVVILHDSPDDFTTQPSGDSGTKIACGRIRRG